MKNDKCESFIYLNNRSPGHAVISRWRSLGRNVSHSLSLKFSRSLFLFPQQIREVTVRVQCEVIISCTQSCGRLFIRSDCRCFFCFTVFQQVAKKKGERDEKKEGGRVEEYRRQRKDEKGSGRENEKREM